MSRIRYQATAVGTITASAISVGRARRACVEREAAGDEMSDVYVMSPAYGRPKAAASGRTLRVVGRGFEWHHSTMATMRDLDQLALAMPQATKQLSDDGRPAYHVHGKLFCFHRDPRRDAIDATTGERLEDVLMFRVADLEEKELLLEDEPGVLFTTRISTAIRPCC